MCPSARAWRLRRFRELGVGFALAPDTNLGAGSEERVIYIYGLPFQRDAEDLTTSGIGLSVWTGGEHQYPLSDRMRIRAGADASRREYDGHEDRITNAQLYDYERTSGELRFVKLF